MGKPIFSGFAVTSHIADWMAQIEEQNLKADESFVKELVRDSSDAKRLRGRNRITQKEFDSAQTRTLQALAEHVEQVTSGKYE